MITPQEKAKDLVEYYFDFNGYSLNESQKETSKNIARKAVWLIIEEVDNIYQIKYWQDVDKEIEKL
jgi:prophage maintenance system killer protein